MTAVAIPIQTPYRLFHVRVARREQLSSSFVRITFSGDGVEHFGDDGPDQRIKVWIPAAGLPLPEVDPEDWYASYRALPDDIRGSVRTYTIRAVRPELAEVDVDFVLHGVAGPASAWATAAAVGDEIALVGPNRAYGADAGGHEWKPPADARTVIVAGDETAAPAVLRILEALARDHQHSPGTRVRAFLEVPSTGDLLDVPAVPNAEVTWLPRGGGNGDATAHGDLLVVAVCHAARDAVDARATVPTPRRPEDDAAGDSDSDAQTLWEVADPAAGAGLYAWIAGEAGTVKTIRRHLVGDLGIDRRQVTFMGYWRLGRSES